jgi:hypothetical protein
VGKLSCICDSDNDHKAESVLQQTDEQSRKPTGDANHVSRPLGDHERYPVGEM